jgi:predicted SprT family Zn-dependent metalloprotease
MTSDTATRRTESAFAYAGTGHAMSFLCAACQKHKPCTGRKLKRVQGIRQYVCRGCAK